MNRFKLCTLSSVILVSACYRTNDEIDDTNVDTVTDTTTNTNARVVIDTDTNVISGVVDSLPEIHDRQSDPCECGDHTGVECVDFSGHAIARGVDCVITGIKVTALCNSNGEPLANVYSVLSDEDGNFTLKNVPRGRIGLLLQGGSCNGGDDLDAANTWHWGVNTDESNYSFYIIPISIYDLQRVVMDYSADVCNGDDWFMLSGATYWVDPASNKPLPMGCGVITIEPDISQTKVFYSADNGLPDKELLSTNPRNGSYLYCGLASAEEYTVTLSVDGEVLVQDSFPVRTIEGEKNSHLLYVALRTKVKPGC